MLKKLIEKIKAACSMAKMRIIGIDYGEPGGDHAAITKITTNQAATAGEATRKAFIKLSANTEDATTTLLSLQGKLKMINRQNTNNWRKMHGLPMRRRQPKRKRRTRSKKKQ